METCESSYCSSCGCLFMEMAEAVKPVADKASLADGDGDMPAGEPTEVGIIKSSRFMDMDMGSVWGDGWSIEFRSCAMPLGGFSLAAEDVKP